MPEHSQAWVRETGDLHWAHLMEGERAKPHHDQELLVPLIETWVRIGGQHRANGCTNGRGYIELAVDAFVVCLHRFEPATQYICTNIDMVIVPCI